MGDCGKRFSVQIQTRKVAGRFGKTFANKEVTESYTFLSTSIASDGIHHRWGQHTTGYGVGVCHLSVGSTATTKAKVLIKLKGLKFQNSHDSEQKPQQTETRAQGRL